MSENTIETIRLECLNIASREAVLRAEGGDGALPVAKRLAEWVLGEDKSAKQEPGVLTPPDGFVDYLIPAEHQSIFDALLVELREDTNKAAFVQAVLGAEDGWQHFIVADDKAQDVMDALYPKAAEAEAEAEPLLAADENSLLTPEEQRLAYDVEWASDTVSALARAARRLDRAHKKVVAAEKERWAALTKAVRNRQVGHGFMSQGTVLNMLDEHKP